MFSFVKIQARLFPVYQEIVKGTQKIRRRNSCGGSLSKTNNKTSLSIVT